MKYTIKYLRQKGYKVRVMHTRHFHEKKRLNGSSKEVSARGGSTTIEITTPDKEHNVFGKSVCSLEDNFNRRVGNEIALGRAIEILKTKISEI
jgi:hypothetical protein